MAERSASFLLEGDLLLEILSHLDIHSLARSQLVCKSWYAAASSRHFFHNFYRHRPRLPMVVLTTTSHQSDNTVSTKLWRCFSGIETRPTSLPLGPPYFRGECSSNGLVCGIPLQDPFERWPKDTIIVGNPVTNAWRVLRPPQSFLTILGIVLDTATGTYKITVVCHNQGWEYDSGSETWSSVHQPHAALWKREESWRAFCGFDGNEKIIPVEEWPPCGCEGIGYFLYGDRRIMATEMTYDDDDYRCGCIQYGVGVWEWDARKSCWFLLSKVRAQDLLGERWAELCLGNLVFWVTHLVGDVVVFGCDLWPPMAYHLVEQRWECGLANEDIDRYGRLDWEGDNDTARLRCDYAFLPNLAAFKYLGG